MAVDSVVVSAANSDIIGRLAAVLGADENALRILVTLLLGYPLAAGYRNFLYGKSSPNVQHLFFTVCGLCMCYFNFGIDTIHSVANIAIIYVILLLFARTSLSIVLAYVVNMIYLCVAYYMTMTDTYTIKWTTPHCVLTLRLIGLVCDVYDGKIKPEKLSEEQRETALVRTPTLLEIFGHSFFFGAFLVGPQFPMKRYQDLINGSYKDHVHNSTYPAIMRLVAGGVYSLIFQVSVLFFPDSILTSDNFNERSLLVKCLIITVWGKFTLYKYVACWLMAEGVIIMSGLTYNGKDKKTGEELWDSCANINISSYERASSCHEMILSFNINTNRWMAKYIFKRLRFLGSKEMSQMITLFFLALWHGLYTGYFMTFGFEFFIVIFEKQVGPMLSSLSLVRLVYSLPGGSMLIWSLKKLYAQFVLGYALVSFCLFTFARYGAVYSSVYWISHVLFAVLWPLGYFVFSQLKRDKRSKSPTNNEEITKSN